jgi:2-(1,2-epoxy-1,2-dihydrophenyl)acetyl-CoA isomerase
MALMMTGDKVSAQEAVDMNMIYKSVPADQFAEVIRLFSENLAKMPTKALGLTKRAMNQSIQNDLTQQLALEELLQTEAGQTHDFNEGVQSFLEKRKPVFIGK